MSFKVKLYTSFFKQMNSTKTPGVNDTFTEFDCVLKDASGIMAPVLGIDITPSGNPATYNYGYIATFNRYYFVKEWQWNEGLWWCYLEEDVLATWKTYIQADQQYILRTSVSTLYDRSIADDMYPTYGLPTVVQDFDKSVTLNKVWEADLSKGYFVISIITEDSDTGVDYYVTNKAGLAALTDYLLSSTSYLQVPNDILSGGVSQELLKTLYNPFQYINSIRWYPFKPATINGSSTSSISYGWWQSVSLGAATFEKLKTNAISGMSFTIQLVTQHPQASARGSWLNTAPFTKRTLYAGPFGSLPLDTNVIKNYNTIYADIFVDCMTGQAYMDLTASTWDYNQNPAVWVSGNELIGRFQCDFGVQMQVSQIALDRLAQAETIITGAADVARDTLRTAAAASDVGRMLNPIAGAAETYAQGAQVVSTATHAIADGVRASFPQMMTKGAQGSLSAFQPLVSLKSEFYSLVPEDVAHNGVPCCKLGYMLQNGYYLIRHPHISMPGNEGELAAVNAYLESGIEME